MHLTKADLTGYYPFSLHDNTRTVVDFTAPVQIIIGDNGCGKSSFLRELSPFPSTSTDYLKNGKRVLELLHNGHQYQVISDFQTGKGLHSLIRDGEELNLSHTSTAQKDLVETELGWTDLLSSLCYHKLGLCKMSKSDRKTYLTALCPFDINFVLEYHKRIQSAIRAKQNQLKSLHADKAELTSKQLKEATIAELQDTQTKIELIISGITAAMVRVDRELQDLPDFVVGDFDASKIASEANTLKRQAIKLRLAQPELFTKTDLATKKHLQEQQLHTNQQRLKECEQQIQQLVAQLNEYQSMLGDEHEKIEADLESSIAALETRLVEHPLPNNVPVISPADAQVLKLRLPQLSQGINNLDTNFIWPSRALPAAQQRCHSWASRLEYLNSQVYHLREQFNHHQRAIAELTGPAEGCTRSCPLLNNYEHTKSLHEKASGELAKSISGYELEIESYKRRLERLKTELASGSTNLPIIKAFEQLILSAPWKDYILNNQTLYRVLKSQSVFLLNNLYRLVEVADLAEQRDKWSNELLVYKTKLQSLREVKRPAQEVLMKIVNENTSLLAQVTAKYKAIEQALLVDGDLIKTIERAILIQRKVAGLRRTIEDQAQEQILNRIREFWLAVRAELQRAKSAALNNLGEIQHTLKTQDRLHSRLHDGIEPMIVKVQQQLDNIRLIEPALSTVNGIPKQYLVQYINYIMSYANDLISKVWSYSLTIDLVSMDDPLDFTFSVTINEYGRIRDLSILSSGQQEIVDLALTVALGSINQTFKAYPLVLDEPDKSITTGGQGRVLELLARLLMKGELTQLFLVNHHLNVYSSFPHCEVFCMNPDNVALPTDYNLHVEMS